MASDSPAVVISTGRQSQQVLYRAGLGLPQRGQSSVGPAGLRWSAGRRGFTSAAQSSLASQPA